MSTALPTASSAYGPNRPSAAATVDNATPQGSTYRRGNSVQTNGATSDPMLLRKRDIKPGLVECTAPDRYPHLSDEDISSETRVEEIPAPYIKSIVIYGSRAKVEVFPAGNKKISHPPSFDLGRNLYFLTKTENGWRISNVMIHTKWPDLNDGTHHCYFSFAKQPNEEEKNEIPKHCR